METGRAIESVGLLFGLISLIWLVIADRLIKAVERIAKSLTEEE